MVVVGLDPGWIRTGYAVVEGARAGLAVREAGVLRSTQGDVGERLRELHREVLGLLREFEPCVVVLEDLFSHPHHPRTAVQLGHVRGVLCLAAAQAGAPVESLAPAEVKRAICGNGRAPKPQVQAAVRASLGLQGQLDSHAADALALAATVLVRAGFPLSGVVAAR
jgi:crossover junction endodeoxyribonuclease RuvC